MVKKIQKYIIKPSYLDKKNFKFEPFCFHINQRLDQYKMKILVFSIQYDFLNTEVSVSVFNLKNTE